MPFNLEKTRRICAAATKEPWVIRLDGVVSESESLDGEPFKVCGRVTRDVKDGQFIAYARTALPAACDEVERLRALALLEVIWRAKFGDGSYRCSNCNRAGTTPLGINHVDGCVCERLQAAAEGRG